MSLGMHLFLFHGISCFKGGKKSKKEKINSRKIKKNIFQNHIVI